MLEQRDIVSEIDEGRLRGASPEINYNSLKFSVRETADTSRTIRDYAVALVKERYADFGPTFAAEK